MRLATSLVLILAATVPALADDEIVRGGVVMVAHQEIYVSLGARHGVGDGAALRIKRPIRLRHPVTRATVEDWVPVGSGSVTQAGASMSRAVIGDLVMQIQVGDVVEALVVHEPPPATPTPPTPPAPGPAAPPPDPAAVEVLGVFAQQTGQPLDVRIAGWERYLSIRAASPYAEAIRRDLEQLRGLRDQLRAPGEGATIEHVSTVRHQARTRATAGEAIPVVFVLDEPERVASAYLHYRTRGARTYRRVLLAREGDVYLRGVLPAEVAQPPGLEYFVEVSAPTGRSGLALASPTEPIAIEVAKPTLLDKFGLDAKRSILVRREARTRISSRGEPPARGPAAGRSSVKLAGDYLDFATFDTRDGDRTDRMVTANVDFTYRLDGVVHSVGVGYGVFAGRGGYADRTWDAMEIIPRSGFHYGYADVEFGTSDEVPLSGGGKLIAGVGRDGFGLGVEARFRVGHIDRANLLLALRTIEQIGTVTDIRFGARPARDLLVGVSVGATNQPNRGDIGVKLGTELEWLGFGNVSLIVRGSWQGRSVAHGGIGAGGGLGFYW